MSYNNCKYRYLVSKFMESGSSLSSVMLQYLSDYLFTIVMLRIALARASLWSISTLMTANSYNVSLPIYLDGFYVGWDLRHTNTVKVIWR